MKKIIILSVTLFGLLGGAVQLQAMEAGQTLEQILINQLKEKDDPDLKTAKLELLHDEKLRAYVDALDFIKKKARYAIIFIY